MIFDSELFILTNIVIVLSKPNVNFFTSSKVYWIFLDLWYRKFTNDLVDWEFCGNATPDSNNFDP